MMTAETSFSPEFIDWLTSVAYDEATELDDLATQELADLWSRVDALREIVGAAHGKVSDSLAPKLRDNPIMLSDGTVLRFKAAPSRTRWRNAELTERILERASREVIDPDTGQRITLVDPSRMRGLMEPTHAVTKLQAIGIEPVAYCNEQWVEKVEAVR